MRRIRTSDRTLRGARIAWSADLGVTPVDHEILRVASSATRVLRGLGARVDEADPDFRSDAARRADRLERRPRRDARRPRDPARGVERDPGAARARRAGG